MSFTVIKGTFHVAGYSPDGDSIRFKAADAAHWNQLAGRKVRLNAKDHVQLRIEAIDTLETHYKGQHQPLAYADAATKKLFSMLGIANVVWNSAHSRVVSADDGVGGYIMSRLVERNGRPVSYVFPSSLAFKDGENVFLDQNLVKKSINFKMLSSGLAYPTFYDGLFYDLRALFAKEAGKARKGGRGVWRDDKTNQFIKIDGVDAVVDRYVLLPKLFRRIVTYLRENDGRFDGKGFIAFLREHPEPVLILSRLHFTHLDNLIGVNEAGKIKLKEKPENLVFLG
ncbi:MAG TPA: nuclease [Betaproteobacteria bacterium]|nr:nuclease [Betaproteobacteria bacterium]